MIETGRQLPRFQFFSPRIIRTVILVLASGLSAVLYLLASARLFTIGFPLDDAWIHQTYARNLVELGQWDYIPGQVSAGSTAPLWTLLLSIGYLFSHSPPYFWTYLLGTISLLGAALAGEFIFRQLDGSLKKALPLAGLFLATEWHLIWGAVSGMETILFAFLILAAFASMIRSKPNYPLTGILIGLSCWVRPDGLTLLGPALFLILIGSADWKQKIRSGLVVLGGFAILFGAYLGFNYSLGSSILPNTFYAKQAEYISMQQTPLLQRLASLASLPAIGAGSLLIPGLAVACWRSIRERDWRIIALLFWWLGYTAIYALRLPVTYQHGRYLIPAMPVIFLIGMAGTGRILAIRYSVNRPGWAFGRLTLITLVAVQLIFTCKGAFAYAEDVAIIETEMVATAEWLNRNTEPDALIAVHDIGAIGYFSQRPLLDLAGLVSPEVIPFIRDEVQLAEFLDQEQAEYLVTFPEWYPYLVGRAQPVFITGGNFAPQAGGENMRVYRWASK
jgi:hypothetical protein